MVDAKKHHRFDELRLHNGPSYGYNRFMRKDRCSFRYGPYITFELKVPEIIEKFFTKHVFAAKIFDIFLCKCKVPEILDKLFKTGHDGISAAVRYSSKKHIEVRNVLCHARLEIAVCHGYLIKVRKHRQIQFFFHFGFPPFCFLL